jgi:uncharacterized protein with HEPN domain
MLRILALTFALSAGFHAGAQESKLLLEAAQVMNLDKVDAIDCNIEILGEGSLRISSTNQNNDPNRYVIVDLGDKRFKLTKKADGWNYKKVVDLAEEAINPLFPKMFYGNETTELEYKEVKGVGRLNVLFIQSTVGPIDYNKTKFSCKQVENMVLDKSKLCPACLSSQKTN